MLTRRRILCTNCDPQEPYGCDLPAPRVLTLSARRSGSLITLRLTTDVAAPFFVYWFLDGQFVARTTGGEWVLSRTGTCNVEALVSKSPKLDPRRWPRIRRARRRTLEWLASADTVDSYRCEYATGESGDTWEEFASIASDGRPSYALESPDLDDLTWYRFRVIPVRQGNDGTALTWDAEYIVRIPDTPSFEVSFDELTGYVTYA